MKTKNKILTAFVLNLLFSVFEVMGGLFCGSVAIISDALHDLGDALSIGVSYFLEKKSTRGADDRHTYGYGRYSVLGGAFTTVVLLVGSVLVFIVGIGRIIHPVPVRHDGMLAFAVIGVVVNLVAAIVTHGGGSVNQRAVSLHMLEDVLGWIAVLVGAAVMKFTGLDMIDPIISIGVSAFIFAEAVKNLREILDVFLEKVPRDVSVSCVREHLSTIDGVANVHHIHLWSIDGRNICATMHIVTSGDTHLMKKLVRRELEELGVSHATLETERVGEGCGCVRCEPISVSRGEYHHHHHHRHQ